MKYYLFYAVVTPAKDDGTPQKVFDRMLRFRFESNSDAQEGLKKFQKEEEVVCAECGKGFVMGVVIRHHKGKITKLVMKPRGGDR